MDGNRRYERPLRKEIFEATRDYQGERESLLSPSAARSGDALRRWNRKSGDIRAPYSRDADRIIHTRAYSRYIDKTQVFYLVRNDHITHRVIHVQLVSKIARTIARSLRLNEDLIEAIALGHDIGHIPYGHFGEQCLTELSGEQGIGRFLHNVQSVRFLDTIENCDLTLQVLDGILSHNGESADSRISPEPCPDFPAFDRKVEEIIGGRKRWAPGTLEGCVVKFADTIAYIGRDLQDAVEVNLLSGMDAVPEACREILGETNGEIINTLINDLLENSNAEDPGYITYSPEVEKALATLREFSHRNIYENPKLTSEREKIRLMYRTLFTRFLRELEEGTESLLIYEGFLTTGWISEAYRDATPPAVIVRDFLAGMTDRYFEARYRETILPRIVDGKFP
ncbi:MAG: HD domain-containing protein [Methanoregulaceae archaeon]